MYAYCGNNPVMFSDPGGYILRLNQAVCMADSGSGGGGGLAFVGLFALATQVLIKAVEEIAEEIRDAIERTVTIQPSEYRDQSVYVLCENEGKGDIRYVGRTNDPARRWNEHRNNKKHPERATYGMLVIATGLTVGQARILEQAIISAYTLYSLDNLRRGISLFTLRDLQLAGARYIELINAYSEDELRELMGR